MQTVNPPRWRGTGERGDFPYDLGACGCGRCAVGDHWSARCASATGYDELTASEVQAVLAEGDDERVKEVLSYERAHKDRAGVRAAAEREVTNA